MRGKDQNVHCYSLIIFPSKELQPAQITESVKNQINPICEQIIQIESFCKVNLIQISKIKPFCKLNRLIQIIESIEPFCKANPFIQIIHIKSLQLNHFVKWISLLFPFGAGQALSSFTFVRWKEPFGFEMMWEWVNKNRFFIFVHYVSNQTFCLLIVLGKDQTDYDASKTPARFFIPASRTAEKSPPVHTGADCVLSCSLDPQIHIPRYHLPRDGMITFYIATQKHQCLSWVKTTFVSIKLSEYNLSSKGSMYFSTLYDCNL